MHGLDFSILSDDQLMGLIRAGLREAADRHPALQQAAQDAVLDEAERLRVMHEAAEREAGRLRALERARLAREAAEQVRAQHAAQEAAAASARGAAAAERARQAEIAKQQAEQGWLRQAADLVGRQPAEISVKLIDTRFGRRVLIDEGDAHYASNHLSDWRIGSDEIRTVKNLVRRKPDLAAFSTQFATAYSYCEVRLKGTDYLWDGHQP